MNIELKIFYDNKIIVFKKCLPQGANPTPTKWVYIIKGNKKKKKDNIEKYKTRLVAKGFTQIKGIDYNLTYSPTLSLDSLKLIFSHDF